MNERIRHLEAAEAYLTGAGDPNGIVNAAEGTAYWDNVGDLLYYNTDGVTAWQVIGGGAPGAPHNLLSATHTDSTPQAVSRGSLVYGDATPTWNELVHPGTMYHLQTDANDVFWSYNITLIDTTTAVTGVVFKGANRFIHNFHHPTGGGAVPVGDNTFVGVNCGNFTMGSTATDVDEASYNTAVGEGALISNTTGYTNTAVGRRTLNSNTTGYVNCAFGNRSLNSNTVGTYNTAYGEGSMRANIDGNGNSAQGHVALENNTSGDRNSAYGYGALSEITTGSYNSAVGDVAGKFLADGFSLNQTTGNSVYVGANTKASADGVTNENVFGYNAIGAGSNTVQIGDTNVTKTLLAGNLGVGVTAPTARTHIDQSSAVGAIPVLTLDQGDVSEQHIVLSMSGADVDFPNILQLAVTGSPALWWDESENSFGLKNISGLLLEDADIIGNSTATARLGFNSSGATDYAYFLGCNVGIGTATPAYSLHVYNGASGATANTVADEGVFEHNANMGISLLSPDANHSNIAFGTASDNIGALIRWDLPNARFTLGAASAGADMYLNSGNNVNTAILTSTNHLLVGTTSDTAQVSIDQPSTTAAIPVLELDQADLSEEFINFISTVGAGNPIDTAALGTYYGKIRVQVQGVGYKMMALYNS